MRTRIHAVAGVVGFIVILTFWSSTVISESFGSPDTIAAVKTAILWGMIVLIPALAIVGASGMSMGRKRTDALAVAKKKRMPFIALNGLIVLVPSALFLASRASAGVFDAWFYGVQALELVAGGTNLVLIGLNIRDGLRMTGRIGGATPRGADRAAPRIEEIDSGPLVVKAAPRIVASGGQALPAKPVVSLCRCGASKTKPFCDGSHSEIGFDSRPSPDRTRDDVRIYEGKDIAIHYNRRLCSHAGECVARLSPVFDSRRKPWIMPDNGSADAIGDVVEACPSGALRMGRSGKTARHMVPRGVGITIEADGPYRVVRVPLASERLAAGASPDKYTLCRCGASKNKPYCDGRHDDTGWRA